MSLGAWIKGGIAGSSVVGLGVVCFIFTTPTDDELIKKFSPELRQKYHDERERREFVGQWAYKEAVKTSKTDDPVWMTGEIPNGMSRGEDGHGRRYDSNTLETIHKELKQNPDRLRSISEGLPVAPPSLMQQQSEWEKRTANEKSQALEEERARLRKLAEKEDKL